MINVKNVVLKDSAGTPMEDANSKRVLSTMVLMQAVLNNVKYKSREDQRKADRVYNKLEDLQKEKKDVEVFEMEDAEFEMVYSYCKDYEPFLQGRVFLPFLDGLDEANNAGK